MIYALGGSGVPNYGDELIAKYWLNIIRDRFPEKRMVLECTSPSVSTLNLQPENWKASHVSFIKSIASERAAPDFWGNVERGYKFIHRKGFQRMVRMSGLEEAIAGAEVFHLIGGGYINQNWPHTGFLLGFAGSLRSQFGTRVVGTGLGIMPISPPPNAHRRMFRRVLDGFEFLESRDAEGANFLVSQTGLSGVARHGLDDTFIMPARSSPNTTGARKLHISCFLQGKNLAELISCLADRKSDIAKQFSEVVFWNCAPHRDHQAATAFRELFPEMKELSLWELIGDFPVSSQDFMITTRFHPHLLAARAGASGYFVESGGAYYQTKHGSVLELGSPFRPISDIGKFEFTSPPNADILNKDSSRVASKAFTIESIYGRLPPS